MFPLVFVKSGCPGIGGPTVWAAVAGVIVLLPPMVLQMNFPLERFTASLYSAGVEPLAQVDQADVFL